MPRGHKICVGQFAAPHGVRGLVKLRSFTGDPESIFVYAPLSDQDGVRQYKLVKKSAAADHYIVAVEGVEDRDAAELLHGERLYIPRDVLPETGKNEFYEADIVGLRVVDAAGTEYGKVMGFHDYGAGIFLEIGHSRKDSFMLPFKDAFVPEVDLDGAKLLIAVPEGWV